MSTSRRNAVSPSDESLEILRRNSVQLSTELQLRHSDLRSPTDLKPPDLSPALQPPPEWYRLAAGFLGTALIVAAMAAWWLGRSPDRTIPERRIGVDYQKQTLNGIVASPESREVFVGTTSHGAYAVSPDSEFLEHFTRESTRGALPSNEIHRLDRSDDAWIYFLVTSPDGRSRDVCRFHATERRWEHLLGGDSFPELASLEQIADVVPLGDRLAVGTKDFGVALYSQRQNGWETIFRKGDSGLASGAVHDLLSAADGTLWVGHAGGLQNLRDGQWRVEPLPPEFAGRSIAQVSEGAGWLWARSTDGGLAVRSGGSWRTVAGPSGWGQRSGAEIVRVLHEDASRQIWCVASDGAVGRYDIERRSWTEMPSLGTAATALVLDPFESGALFAGTVDGVKRLPPKGTEWSLFFAGDGPVTGLAAAEGRLVSIARGPDEDATVVSAYDPAAGWRRIVGTGAAALGPRGALAVAFDDRRQQLYVGSERGLSIFDVRTHEWRAGDDALAGQPLIDLAMFDDQVLVVGADHRVHRWNPDAPGVETWLGGGELPRRLSDVSAVTTAADGALWLAAGNDLFRYDVLRHAGERVLRLEAPIRSMSAAKTGLWIASNERPWFLAYGKRDAASMGNVKGLVRLFADVASDRALWIERGGRVHLVETPGAAPQLVVGDAALGLQLSTVSTVAHSGPTLVVGGESPHVYDDRIRSWKPLAVGPVEQAVAAAGLLWLRTSDLRLFSLDPFTPAPVERKFARPVKSFAGDADRLVAILDDNSLWQFTVGSKDAKAVRTAAVGPPASMLTGRPLLVSGDADHIDLAGGADRRWWRYSWKESRWFPVRKADATDLTGISQFATGLNRTYALAAGGTLYSHGDEPDGKGRLEGVSKVVSITSTGGEVSAIDSSSATWLNQGGSWKPLVGPSPLSDPRGQKVVDMAPLPDGLVLTTARRTAVLHESLSDWQTVAGDTPASRLYSNGKTVWGRLADDRIARLKQAGNQSTWEPLALDGTNRIVSFTAGCGADGTMAFIATPAGEVYRVDADRAAVWRTAAGAPGTPADLVGVVETPTGFLCAFRTGQLGHCDREQLVWENAVGPKADKLDRLVATPGDPGTWWLLAADGKLYRARAQLPPAWFIAKTNVNDIALAGDELIAASSEDGTLTRFHSSGRSDGFWRSNPPDQLDLTALAASAELDVDGKGTLLVVSDGRVTSAYDPSQRLWTEAAKGTVEMIPAGGQLVARRADGTVARISWKNDRLEFDPRNEWNGAVAIAVAGKEGTAVAGLWDDGRLTVRDGDAPLRTLVGRQLPSGLPKGRPLAVGGDGDRFFFVHNDGQIAAYSPAARQWQVLGKHSRFLKLAVHADEAWVEESINGTARLGVWREAEGKWSLHRVPGALVGWRPSPAGIVATLNNADALLFPKGGANAPAADGAAVPEAPKSKAVMLLPPGPAEATLQGVRSTPLGHFLHDDKGRLFQYDPSKHAWIDVTPGDAPFREILLHGSVPVLLDRKGQLWLGNRTEDTRPWSFDRLAENITALDLRNEQLAYADDEAIVVLSLPKSERLARFETPVAWPAAPQKVVAAVGDGPTLAVLGSRGDSARYSPATRVWKRSPPPPPWVADRLWIIDSKLHLGDATGRIARLVDTQWETAAASSSTSWNVGDDEWRIDPAGGFSKGKAESAEPAKPLPSAEPVRVHAGTSTAWLELAGSILCRYDLTTHRLTVASRPAKDAPDATGIVRAGDRAWFVRESEKLLIPLSDDAAETKPIPLPETFPIKSVFESGEDIVLDSGEALFVASTGAVLEGEERKQRLKEARPLVPDRLQSSAGWKIVTDTSRKRRLTWNVAGLGVDVPIDTERVRLKWDDAYRVMHDGRHTFVATAAGVAVYGVDVAGLPLALLPMAAADEPSEVRFAKFSAEEPVLAFSRGSRRWSLQSTADGAWRLARLAAPASAWTVRESAGRVSISWKSRMDDEIPVSLSNRGTLDFDVPTSLALSDGGLLVTTREFQVSYSKDPAETPTIARRSGTLVTRSPRRDQILHRDVTGVRKLDRTGWTDSNETLWNATLAERALADRKDRKTPVRLQMSSSDDAAPIEMPYVAGRLAIDQPAPFDRAMPGGRGPLLTVAGETVVYGNAWGVGMLEKTPKGADRIRFAPVRGGVQDFAWLPGDSSPTLLWKSAAGDVLEWHAGVLSPSSKAWPDEDNAVTFGKRTWQVQRDGAGPIRLTPADGTDDPWVLDPSQRGFLHDQFRKIGGDPASNSIWGAAGARLERFVLDDASSGETFPALLPVERLVPVGGRLLCLTAITMQDLTDPEHPKVQPPDSGWEAALRDGLAGRRWRLRRNEGRPALEYRFPSRPVDGEDGSSREWMPVGLQPRAGLLTDRIQRVTAEAEGRIVVDTPIGLWRVSTKSPGLDGAVRLPNPFPAGSKPLVSRLWTSSAGHLWLLGNDELWRRLDREAGKWTRGDKLPDSEQAARAVLHAGAWTWTRTAGDSMELRRGENGNESPLVVRWTAGKKFDFEPVRAAMESGDTAWLLCARGLCQLDAARRQIVRFDDRPFLLLPEDGEFLQWNGAWHVRVIKGTTQKVLRLEANEWIEVTGDDDPWTASRTLWETNSARATGRDAQRVLQIKTHEGEWQDAAFLPEAGCFDFQTARAALPADGRVHTLSTAGVTTWTRKGTRLVYSGLLPGCDELAVQRAPLAAFTRGKDIPWQEFFEGRWRTADAPPNLHLVLASTARWKCTRADPDSPAVLRIAAAAGEWHELPLHPDGDFEFHRPEQIAVDGVRLIAVSQRAASGWNIDKGSLDWIAPATAFPLNDGERFLNAFVHDGSFHAVTKDRAFALDAKGMATPADPRLAAPSTLPLLDSPDWEWKHVDGGEPRLARRIGQKKFPLAWNPTVGRFDVDEVTDVFHDNRGPLLATAAGVISIDATSRQSIGLVPSPRRQSDHFVIDRLGQRLLIASAGESPAMSPLVKDPESAEWSTGDPVPAEEAADLASTMHANEEWRFTTGERRSMQWRGLPSDLSDGRFLHDLYRAVLPDDKRLWLETPAGAIGFDREAAGVSWTRSLAWNSDGAFRLLSATGGVLDSADDGGAVHRWDAESGDWKPVPDAPAERVLVSTPQWRWTRDGRGLRVALNAVAANALEVLPASGRFAFDDVACALPSGNAVWLGSRDGLVRRSLANTTFEWQRQSRDAADARFGSIERMGRFHADGRPIRNGLTGAASTEALSSARNEEGETWTLDTAKGTWVPAEKRLWDGPGGLWLDRTETIGIVDAEDGPRFVHVANGRRVSGDTIEFAPLSLENGRFAIDVVRGITFDGSRVFAATDAGVVELSPDGRTEHFWNVSTAGDSLAGCRRVFRHDRDQRVCILCDGEGVFTLDPKQNAWAPQPVDEEFRATANTLHRDSSWTWNVWDGQVALQVAGIEAGADWPLFHKGRFSWDAPDDLKCDGGKVWLTTAAGLTRRDAAEGFRLASLDRQAVDRTSGEGVPLDTAARFLPGSDLRLHRGDFRFERRDDRWERVRASPESQVLTLDAGATQVTFAPRASLRGLDVVVRSQGDVLRRMDGFQSVPYGDIVGAAWLNGSPWIITPHALIRSRTRP